jgi:hypothetical protein
VLSLVAAILLTSLTACGAVLLFAVVAVTGSHVVAGFATAVLLGAVGIPVGYHLRDPVCTVVIDGEEDGCDVVDGVRGVGGVDGGWVGWPVVAVASVAAPAVGGRGGARAAAAVARVVRQVWSRQHTGVTERTQLTTQGG